MNPYKRAIDTTFSYMIYKVINANKKKFLFYKEEKRMTKDNNFVLIIMVLLRLTPFPVLARSKNRVYKVRFG